MRSGAMLTGSFKVAKVGKRSGPRRPAPTTTGTTSQPPGPVGRVPRVARLMALAITLDGMIRSGEVTSQRELAAVARVTPARVTQILNLLHLAPDLQEQLLAMSRASTGRERLTERHLRELVAEPNWGVQRTVWAHLLPYKQ